MISGSMAFSTDSMVGTSWGKLLGMTGTGTLMGSGELAGRCIFSLISFLFFLAGVWRKESLIWIKILSRETQSIL